MQNYSQIECHVEPSRSFCFVFNSHSCLLSRLTGSRRKSCVLATYVVLSKIYYYNYRMRKVNSFWICHHIIHVVCGKDKILNASCVTCTIIFSRHWNTNGVQIELSPSYTGVHSNVKCMAFFPLLFPYWNTSKENKNPTKTTFLHIPEICAYRGYFLPQLGWITVRFPTFKLTSANE